MLMNVRTSAVTVRVALASALAFVPAAGAFAQAPPQSQGQGQGVAQGQSRQAQVAGPVRAQEQGPAAKAAVDVPFAAAAGSEGEQAVNGVFTIQRFVHEGTQVLAIGKVTATTTNTEGAVQTVVTQARLPVLPTTVPGEVCSTLHLELGPLDVELPGRRIQLDQIAVDIAAQTSDVTATPGAANELASAVCEVSRLLDAAGLGNAGAEVAARLNQLFGILG